jgi:hypothetical protein
MKDNVIVPLAPTVDQMKKYRVHYATAPGATAVCRKPAIIKTKDWPLVTCRGCQGHRPKK